MIVGLGGTGAYLLDLLAKTPIEQIHLNDDDLFGTHNAFQHPGRRAWTNSRRDEEGGLLHRGLRAHPSRDPPAPCARDRQERRRARDAYVVFLAMESSPEKKTVVEALINAGVPFIDTGVGVSNDPNGIAGQIRVTTSTPGRTTIIARDGLISFVAGDDAAYDTNLQVAELDVLAGGHAVMRFKKSSPSTPMLEEERHSVYATDTNELLQPVRRERADQAAAPGTRRTRNRGSGATEDAAQANRLHIRFSTHIPG